MGITAVIIVDHGSRSEPANRLLTDIAARFGGEFASKYPIVEPAHMELAEPTIASAFARCVERGASHVIVCPFFLAPGKHMQIDIPRLAAEAAALFPGTSFRVAAPLGFDELMIQLLDKRVGEALNVRSKELHIPIGEAS